MDAPPTTIAPAEFALKASGLGVMFPGGTEALRSIDLTVARGEFLSLVGPSGCGKSTLLRIIAGLLKPTSGTLDIYTSHSSEAIGFVFQQPTLLPWRTVERNIQLPLELHGKLDAAGRERVEETLELVGLKDFRKHRPRELSGGMQMRVSLARALVGEPSLLLLDEPFAALDDITRQRLNEELLAMWERRRFTALFVTHNVSEAVYLSTRILVMTPRPGHIAEEHRVGFPYPRGYELRAEAGFAALAGSVSTSLRRSHV